MTHCRMVPAAVALALLAGCGTDTDASAASDPVPTGPPVPSVVGLELDRADEQLQAAGFGQAGASDALRDRSPIVRSDWQVCTQQPGPGPSPVGTTLVGVTIVQRTEMCPGAATAATAAPPTTTAEAPSVAPTRRPHVPRTTTTPTTTPAPTEDAVPTDEPGPAVTAGTRCPTAGDRGVTKWGTAVVCRAGSDGRTRWRPA